MKELAYDLIIEFLKTEDEADAAYYIRGVNDMLKVAEAECDNDDNDDESEGESDDGSHGCEAVDVDAGESDDEESDGLEVTTKVTKQGVRVKTSNIDLGHLASLRSKGMTYKSIGDRLGIAPSTVCTLYKKYLSQFE